MVGTFGSLKSLVSKTLTYEDEVQSQLDHMIHELADPYRGLRRSGR